MQLSISNIHLNYINNKNYHVYYPNGRPYGILMHFTSPAKILTSSGMKDIYPGECILTFSGTPAEIVPFKNRMEGFSNNNLTFIDEDPFKEAIRQYNVPHHTIIKNLDFVTINSLFNKIYLEQTQQPTMYREQIDLLMRELFIYLGRSAVNTKKQATVPKNNRLHLMMQALRKEMYLYPRKYPTVQSMADIMNVSPGYFRTLYKTLFDVSPIQDLLNARMQYAKTLLATKDNTITEIANQCGFTDENYFARTFKTHMKMSPREYRKQWEHCN